MNEQNNVVKAPYYSEETQQWAVESYTAKSEGQTEWHFSGKNTVWYKTPVEADKAFQGLVDAGYEIVAGIQTFLGDVIITPLETKPEVEAPKTENVGQNKPVVQAALKMYMPGGAWPEGASPTYRQDARATIDDAIAHAQEYQQAIDTFFRAAALAYLHDLRTKGAHQLPGKAGRVDDFFRMVARQADYLEEFVLHDLLTRRYEDWADTLDLRLWLLWDNRFDAYTAMLDADGDLEAERWILS